jgi:hypothetical protein
MNTLARITQTYPLPTLIVGCLLFFWAPILWVVFG